MCAHSTRVRRVPSPRRVYLSSGELRSLTRRMTRPRLRVASQDPEAKEGHARARSTWPIRVPRPAILREHVTRCPSRTPRPPPDADELEGPSAVHPSFPSSANGSAPAMGGSTADRACKTILAPPLVVVRIRTQPRRGRRQSTSPPRTLARGTEQEGAVLRVSACVRTEMPRASSLIGSCPGKKATMSAGTGCERPRR